MKKLTNGSIPVVPALHLATVDVRDCAQGHINALLAQPGTLQGQRISLSQKSMWMSEQMKIISSHFKEKGLPKVATREVGKKTLAAFGLFDAQVRLILPFIGKQMFINNEKS